MAPWSRAALLWSLLVFLTLSGCISDDKRPSGSTVESERGTLFAGWDYDALTMQSLDAKLNVTLDPDRDLVRLDVRGVWPDPSGKKVPFRIDFTPNATDAVRGGVVEPLWPGRLPTVPIRLLAVGTAVIQVGNETLVDVYTDNTTWAARFVALDNGIREVRKEQVLKADRSGLFDPKTPDDVFLGTDAEAMLILASARDEDLAPLPIDVAETVEARGMKITPLDVDVAGSTIHVVIDLERDGPDVGPISIDIIDPAGDERARQAKGVLQQSQRAEFQIFAEVRGTWGVKVQSTTAAANYAVTGEIVPVPHPVWWLHWESVTFGAS